MPEIKLKKREAMIAGFLAALLLLFIFDKIFLSGIRSKLNDLRLKISNEESRFMDGSKIVYKKEEIMQDYGKYKSFINTDESSKEILTSFLQEVEGLVKISGGSVVSFSPRQESEKKGVSVKYLADLQIEIDPKQLLKFFSSVQESRLLIAVDSFSVSPKNEQASILKLDAVLSMSVYSQ